MTQPTATPPSPEGRLADLDDATLAELARDTAAEGSQIAMRNAEFAHRRDLSVVREPTDDAGGWFDEAALREDGFTPQQARFIAACSPERITALVLAARGLVEIQRYFSDRRAGTATGSVECRRHARRLESDMPGLAAALDFIADRLKLVDPPEETAALAAMLSRIGASPTAPDPSRAPSGE